MNLGLALLGTGDADRRSRCIGGGRADRRTPPHYLPYLVSAALTPLNLLGEAADPPVRGDNQRDEGACGATSYGVGRESPAQVASVRIELFVSLLQWRAKITDFDPSETS